MNCERGSKSPRTLLLTCHTRARTRYTENWGRRSGRRQQFSSRTGQISRGPFETFLSVNPTGSPKKRVMNSTRQLTLVYSSVDLKCLLEVSVYKYVPTGTQGQIYSYDLRKQKGNLKELIKNDIWTLKPIHVARLNNYNLLKKETVAQTAATKRFGQFLRNQRHRLSL